MLCEAQNDNQRRLARLSQTNKVVERVKSQEKLRHLIATVEQRSSKLFPPRNKGHSLNAGTMFPQGTVHEVWGQKAYDYTPVTALPMTLLKGKEAPLLWVTSRLFVQEYGYPNGAGLKALGIDPARLLFVICQSQKEVLWAVEEGLGSKVLAAVIAELGFIDLKASRRLNIAAQKHDTRALLLIRSEAMPSTAAYSRWQVEPAASVPDPFNPQSPGDSKLAARLVKHRGGQRPMQQTVDFPYATDHLPVVAPLADQLENEGEERHQAVG